MFVLNEGEKDGIVLETYAIWYIQYMIFVKEYSFCLFENITHF
jgi:hypothetical protein